MNLAADPKPAPRIVNPDLLRILHLEFEMCEVTGRTGRLHLHHVVLRSQGGDDVRANLLTIHDGLHEAYHRAEPHARFLIGTHIRDHRSDILDYLRTKLGEGAATEWLTRHTG